MKRALQYLLVFVGGLIPKDTYAQTPIPDITELTALLDFYNSTSANGTAAWTSNAWNRTLLRRTLGLEAPATATQTFDEFDLVFNPTNQTYTSGHLPGVRLNADKDVESISIGSNWSVRGAIPGSIVSLGKLKELTIPSFSSVSENNQITGTLPNLSALSNLMTLRLQSNDCTGTVDWLGTNGSNLTSIDLSSNAATSGTRLIIYPGPAFASLTQLNTLTLDNNYLTTVASPVDNRVSVHFRHLDNLTTLSIAGCNLNSGSFIDFDNVMFDDMAGLRSINLSNNPIIDVPSQIAKLTGLTSLDLTNVGLQSLQTNFSLLVNLERLILTSNNLTNNTAFQDIVEILKNCPQLETLVLSINNFSDLTSNFNLLTQLQYLHLDQNPVGGSDLINLQGSGIIYLNLEACALTSKLPSTLINLASLTTLELGNQILGSNYNTNPKRNLIDLSVPGVESVLKNLHFLKALNMPWHAIAGPAPLPSWFGAGFMNQIENLNLSTNEIQLPLPASFFAMTSLKNLAMDNNSLSGSLPAGFTCTAFPGLTAINLSNNALTLPLPNLGGCNFLSFIDISHNQFTGALPEYFETGLTALTYLKISSNEFSALPDLTKNQNAGALTVDLSNNLLDFGDLNSLFDVSCIKQIGGTLTLTPQKMQTDKKGDPATFRAPEGYPTTLHFQAPGQNNYYEWHVASDNSLFGPAFATTPPFATNDSQLIPQVTPVNAVVYRTQIRNRCISGLQFTGNDVHLIIVPPLCQSEIPNKPGVFKLDKLTGSIVFERDDCPAKVPVSCAFGPVATIDNVISANAISHSDNWSYSFLGLASSANPFENGERGKWRAKASYVQNAPIIQSNDKNYNGGTFSFKPFNYRSGEKSNYPGWLKVNQIEKYTQHGQVGEELNAVNIPSTAKFGYHESVPYLVAQNATYQSVLFESFENEYEGAFEDQFVRNGAGVVETNTVNFHAGRSSLRFAGATSIIVRPFAYDKQFHTKGMQMKVWVKGAIANNLEVQLLNIADVQIGSYPFQWVASSGEWSLYEVSLSPSVFSGLTVCPSGTATCPSGSLFKIRIAYTGGGTIYLDDLRVQPRDAEMTAYVYDTSTLRLLAVFDDQHFGLYYQYNPEGKLTRKILETERGQKTIQETQYNSRKVTTSN